MIAGPNGSGKSTIRSDFVSQYVQIYVNSDEIEANIRGTGLDLAKFGIQATMADVEAFLDSSSQFALVTGSGKSKFSLVDGVIQFEKVAISSYLAAALADFIRQRLLEQRKSFTFETVMSHASKVALLSQAKELGYRTYLYYVATEDPDINIQRIENRVKLGGHSVPIDKIRERYYRSLDLLLEAILISDRAYIFDNSGGQGECFCFAEVTGGTNLEFLTDEYPHWFKSSVVDRIGT